MNKIKLELKWALIFTAVSLLWMLFEKAMGWHDELIDKHATYTNFIAPIAVAVYVFALLDKRKQLGGLMTWKQGFVSGAIITMIVAILSPAAQYITHHIISPEYFPNAITYAMENPQVTGEQMVNLDENERLTQLQNYFSMSNYIVLSFIGALLMGFVTSAIVAIFVKKS